MYLSRYNIEAIAGRVITAYRKLPDLSGQVVNKVVPELLVSRLLGLAVEFHTLSPDGTILGLTACDEVEVTVFNNQNRPEYCYMDGKTLFIDNSLISEDAPVGRYHFTLVHEACHQIYKMLFPQRYMNEAAKRQIHYCTSYKRICDWEEWRTNTLTSAVLMPADMVRSNMAAFGLGNHLRMLNKVFAPDEYDRFCEMAQYMGVSKQALSIRLKQLGLLEKDYLQDPYALVDVYPEEHEQQW